MRSDGCGCSGQPGARDLVRTFEEQPGHGGSVVEPFPRQVLLGRALAAATYYSPVYDSRSWRSAVWWIDVYAGLPAAVMNPATVYLQTSDDLMFPAPVELIPGGEDPNIGTSATGAVTGIGLFCRVRVDVVAAEAVSLAVRLVARRK